jgi:hypothetical protein
VASAVLDADGGAVAALSVTLRSGRTDLRRLGPAVRTAALSVSRGLPGALRGSAADGPAGRAAEATAEATAVAAPGRAHRPPAASG